MAGGWSTTEQITPQTVGLFAPILHHKIGGRQTVRTIVDPAQGSFLGGSKPQRLYHGDRSKVLTTPYKTFERTPGRPGLYCVHCRQGDDDDKA